jgi:hypothetical protein
MWKEIGTLMKHQRVKVEHGQSSNATKTTLEKFSET